MKNMMSFRILSREGMDACQRGELENALFQLHMALKISLTFSKRILEAKVRNNLGVVYLIKKEPEKALLHLCAAQYAILKEAGSNNSLYQSIRKNIAKANTMTQETTLPLYTLQLQQKNFSAQNPL